MDSRTCASALFCPCILIGKVHWRIKQKELKLDPLQSNCQLKNFCNSPCYLSLFCLCPCFVAKYSSYVRSLYAISAKKYDKLLSYICCSYVLLQIDREIRAREGETRLRTNQSYNLNPVLTQPELSLPMKYISPRGTKAISEKDLVQARKATMKLATPSVLTKKKAAEKSLEKRVLILRDVLFHQDSSVRQSCGVELKVPKCDLAKNFNLKISPPQQQSGELSENLVTETTTELNFITSCDNTAHSGPCQDKIEPGLSSSHDSLNDRIDIIEANQNSHTKELLSSSTFTSQVSRKYSKSPPGTKRDEDFIPANYSRQEVGLTREDHSTKSDVTPDFHNRKLVFNIPELESGAICERYHKKDVFSEQLEPFIDVMKTVNYSSIAPVLIPKTTGLHHLEGVHDANNQGHERFIVLPDLNAATESANSMDYEDVHSATVVDTPKIKGHRNSYDLTAATFASGIDEHIMGQSSVSKRSSKRSQPLNLQDMTDFFKSKLSKSDEKDRLLTDQLKLDSNADIKKPVGVQSKKFHDNHSPITNLCEKVPKRDFRSSSPSGSQLSPISKLPIRINRDIWKSQSFNRPKLSPVLSNENIYRSREKDSQANDFPRLLSTYKDPDICYDGQQPKSSLYLKNFTNNISTNFVTRSSNSLKSIPSIKLPQILPGNRPVAHGKVGGNDEFEEENSAPVDQAAQRALKLILMSSSAGIK
ncbi:hypothetical protein Golomagni_03301 [Golovinomyces magnicellulatus]|nr:hypothetical protein Golomagni_03301 [Golovinomyces magnicellulatus]